MEHFLRILTRPDNIAITGMLLLVLFFFGLAFSRALKNDRRGVPRDVDRVHVWPYLTRLEFLVALAVTGILTVWSITVDAPLEQPADPNRTPNPSKAPWYFLGLQEMLVYFDPWIAGVVLPALIILGLMAIPYFDVNPKGSGYYTLRERPFAIAVFSFGFVLWVVLLLIGTFLRGPGWYLFPPWEPWDPHKVVAITNVDLPEMLGIHSKRWAALFGGAVLAGYYALCVPAYGVLKKRNPELVRKLGPIRYAMVSFLILTMLSLPIRMVLRIAFNVKYVWVTPWFNV